MNCPGCNQSFSDLEHTPHLLPACGHSLCHRCLLTHFAKGRVRCFACGEFSFAEIYSDFPKNISLSDFITQLDLTNRRELIPSAPNFTDEVRIDKTSDSESMSLRSDPSRHILFSEKLHVLEQPLGNTSAPQTREKCLSEYQRPAKAARGPKELKDRDSLLQNSVVTSIVEGRGEPNCSIHAKPFEAFCLTDSKLLCVRCLLEKTHRHHEVESPEPAFEKLKGALLASIDQLNSRELAFAPGTEGMLRELDSSVRENFEYALKKVDVCFGELKNLISRRRADVLTGMQWVYQDNFSILLPRGRAHTG